MSEENKLKAKINALIDKITVLKSEVQSKDSYIQLLEAEITMLQKRENFSGAESMDGTAENEIFAFLKDFCKIAKLIIANESYIKYNYETKNSSIFYKVQQSVFEDYICTYAELDLKKFINFCVDLTLVKSEKSRKCVYNSGPTTVYYISKNFVDAAAGKLQKAEAGQGV